MRRTEKKLYRRAERTVDKPAGEIMAVRPKAEIDRVRRSLQAMRRKLTEIFVLSLNPAPTIQRRATSRSRCARP